MQTVGTKLEGGFVEPKLEVETGPNEVNFAHLFLEVVDCTHGQCLLELLIGQQWLTSLKEHLTIGTRLFCRYLDNRQKMTPHTAESCNIVSC